MEIRTYTDVYKDEVINLILDIQNNEAGIGISIEEQPDLLDIASAYLSNGGFWVALEGGNVIGTIGLMIKRNCGILKKFFVKADYRSCHIGLSLYNCLLEFAIANSLPHIILDTPSVATKSHKFYEKAGFHTVTKDTLPIEYNFPDRNSLLYQLDL